MMIAIKPSQVPTLDMKLEVIVIIRPSTRQRNSPPRCVASRPPMASTRNERARMM